MSPRTHFPAPDDGDVPPSGGALSALVVMAVLVLLFAGMLVLERCG